MTGAASAATGGSFFQNVYQTVISYLRTDESVASVAREWLVPIVPEGDQRVREGYGEWVVFDRSGPLDKSRFERIWPFLAERPVRGDLSERVKSVDPDIETCFVPRTLYELVFVVECIAEDRGRGRCCFLLDAATQDNLNSVRLYGKESPFLTEDFRQKVEAHKRESGCWHLAYFQDGGDPRLPEICEVAWRLNNLIAGQFPLHPAGMTFNEIKAMAEVKIEYLKQYYLSQQDPATQVKELLLIHTPGPATSFGVDQCNVGGRNLKPMAINDDRVAEIFRRAIAHESSVSKAVLLYRGAVFEKDVSKYQNFSDRIALFYGTGLLAGFLFDMKACAYARAWEKTNAYILTVPEHELANAPFHIPLVPAVCQFYGHGDRSQARSRICKEGAYAGTKADFLAFFQKCMDRAIFLK